MARFRVWTLYCCCLVFGNGEHLCKDKLLKRSNVSTELQSDVLLPCDFDPALLGSDKTADIAVQWRQINTTSHGLLEISLQGEAMFWNSKERRIKHFPKLSESGNFSVLLQKVQPYDLSLYTCELFNGTRSIGCQEIELVSLPLKSISIAGAVAAIAGAVLLFLVLICFWGISNKRKPQPQPESRRESCYTEVMYTLQITEQP
ncbi:hypothetical protein KOW79_022058 [Hemibagrus wyckioides]|uniref:Ig-like domain-containing protein n=1 Tax=Hemibagrus wyckioides TaxID=337641 RepID=A0A9D3N3A1_9TELE|nr:hypothetical protein KOW79_022058 [Hemibagrus wyckioides]